MTALWVVGGVVGGIAVGAGLCYLGIYVYLVRGFKDW
jgi:hypothetical protein